MASNEILCLLWEGWNQVRGKYAELPALAWLCYFYLLVLVTQSSVSGVSEPALESYKSKRAQHSCLQQPLPWEAACMASLCSLRSPLTQGAAVARDLWTQG